MNNWYNDVLDAYEKLGIEDIIPIAHMRVQPQIGILLTDSGLFCGAMMVNERVTIPCTCRSECRTSGAAPHPIHDNMSYISEISGYEERHELYMNQLKKYIECCDDGLARAVYEYLKRGTIRNDIKDLIPFCKYSESQIMIVFTTKSYKAVPNKTWTNYYLSKLPENGICSITGEPDYIPDMYPRGIRWKGDMAKLFFSERKPLNNMPIIAPGYRASQKIIHTLQFMFHEGKTWAYSNYPEIMKNCSAY